MATSTEFEELKIRLKEVTDARAAIRLIDGYLELHPNDDEALTARGIKHWSLGDRSAAINDYLAAIRINPQSRAAMALKAANEILDYRNTDLYNP